MLLDISSGPSKTPMIRDRGPAPGFDFGLDLLVFLEASVLERSRVPCMVLFKSSFECFKLADGRSLKNVLL